METNNISPADAQLWASCIAAEEAAHPDFTTEQLHEVSTALYNYKWLSEGRTGQPFKTDTESVLTSFFDSKRLQDESLGIKWNK